jgi:ATP-binding cassette subfamily B protein
MKLLYSYLRRYNKLIALALALATINQVFSMLDPFIFGKILDRYANRPFDYSFGDYTRGVVVLLLFTMGVAMVSRIAKNFQDYFVNVIIQRLGARVYQDGLRHSLHLPFQVFEDQKSGQTLNILQKVRTDTERLIGAFVGILFPSLVGIIFVAFYAISLHWSIAPVYFTAVPIIFFVSTVLSKNIKKIQKRILGQTTELAGATTESLRNIELIKSLGLAKQEEERLNNTTDRILALELKKVRFIRSLAFIQGTLINALRTGILFILLLLIPKGIITTGEMVTLLFYSFFIFGPLQEIGSIINIYRESEASLNNFNEILSTPVEPRPSNPTSIDHIRTLEFERVGFKHRTANSRALDDISFTARKGETIAFVGPSGSGKTTLVKLLVGLYQPDEGRILYNDIPGSEVNLEELRGRVGFVTQDTQLFSGSIRENLLFVNPAATEEHCYEVLYKAACHNLLARADKGLDTVIGEGGIKISGGEKQRLSIARALLRDPDLIVFDEATSSLDSLTEDEITQTIRDVSQSKERITILIAHRLSTVMHADRIFVLERGRIIEQGRHLDLIETKGLYYAMWRQQIGENRGGTQPPERKEQAPLAVA